MRRILYTICALSQLLIVSCGDLLDDGNFQIWCGESLCSWETETGSIRRTGTWHDHDYGVEFVDSPTTISQLVGMEEGPRLGTASDCIVLRMIADVDSSTMARVEIDLDDDGVIELSQMIGAQDWRPVEFLVSFDGKTPQSVRFSITKRAPGRAILGRIQALATSNCAP